MNQTQKLVFAASIWTRTDYQVRYCLMGPKEKMKFMSEIKESNILNNGLIMLIAIMTRSTFLDIAKEVGDIRNCEISTTEIDEIDSMIRDAGQRIL